MDNIEDILRALAGDEEEETTDAGEPAEEASDGLFSGMDIGSIAKIAGLLGSINSTSDDERLLLALRPLLRSENQSKVDTALKLLKLISLLPLLKDSGLFGQGGK